MRPSSDALVEAILVLTTLGAPEQRRLRRRKPQAVTEVDAEPVPTTRATVARSAPFPSPTEARHWLAALRADPTSLAGEVDAAVIVVNRALHAHRVAAADPYVTEVSAERALVVRVGYGSGEEVAEGRFGEGLELPRSGSRRARRSMEAPEERFARLLSGREDALPAEELVLRARADLNAGRLQEAALQARVGIEALLAAIDSEALATHRDAAAAAANAALRGTLAGAEAAALEEAVAAMEQALKRHRLGA